MKNKKRIIILLTTIIIAILIAVGVSVKASGSGEIAKSITFTENMDGKYVYVRAVDAAGNKGEWSEAQRVWIDNTAPTVTAKERSVTITEGDVKNLADYFTVVANGANTDVEIVCTIGGVEYSTTEALTANGSPYTVTCTASKSGGVSNSATMEIVVEKDNLIVIMPDNIILSNNMYYISPGSSYEFKLKKEKKQEIIDAQNIKWTTENEYIQIDENGIITLSDNATYGNAVITGIYNEQKVSFMVITLHRIKLGSSIKTTIYTADNDCDLFEDNTFKVNDSLNMGIVPGEAGYTLIAPNGYNTEYNAEITAYITPIKYGGGTNIAKWNINLSPIGMDLRLGNLYQRVNVIGESEVNTNIILGIASSVDIPMKIYGTLIDSNGECITDSLNGNRVEMIELLSSNNENYNATIASFVADAEHRYAIRIDFKLPSWEELTNEELQNIIELMSSDISYTANMTIRIQQIG